MPSAEDCINAQNDVRERCIKYFVAKGHPRYSAEEIVKRMSYQEQADLIGQKTGVPYSPY